MPALNGPARQVNARDFCKGAPRGYPVQEQREHKFSFALHSDIRAQIPQGSLGEDTVTRPTQNDGRVRQAPADRHNIADRNEKETGLRHILVVDVAHRNPDDVLGGDPR